MTIKLKKSDVERVLLFEGSLDRYIICVFKDGSAKYMPMNSERVADIAKTGIPMVSVGSLANG
jgi:hypothetical protein